MNDDEFDINQAVKVFEGEQFTLALAPRGGELDPHVLVVWLLAIESEDGDENKKWYIYANANSHSAYWLHDKANLIEQAMLWLQHNAIPCSSGHGWRFKDDNT